MNVQERLEDIATLSGYSKDVVHAVIKASMDSLVKSLRVGDRATLPGLCSFKPQLASKLSIESGAPELYKHVAIKAEVSRSLLTKLEDLDDFEAGIESTLYKIPNVASHQLRELE